MDRAAIKLIPGPSRALHVQLRHPLARGTPHTNSHASNGGGAPGDGKWINRNCRATSWIASSDAGRNSSRSRRMPGRTRGLTRAARLRAACRSFVAASARACRSDAQPKPSIIYGKKSLAFPTIQISTLPRRAGDRPRSRFKRKHGRISRSIRTEGYIQSW